MTWTYKGYSGEAKGPAPILERLHGWLAVFDPGGRFLGIMPSPQHRRDSPHSVHNSGRALDWGPENDATGWKIAHTLADFPHGADIDLILWKDYQWGGSHGPTWIKTGRHDHDTHLHIETRGWG